MSTFLPYTFNNNRVNNNKYNYNHHYNYNLAGAGGVRKNSFLQAAFCWLCASVLTGKKNHIQHRHPHIIEGVVLLPTQTSLNA